jgi:hypothetical protein
LRTQKAVEAGVPFSSTIQVDAGLANRHPSKSHIRKTNHQNEFLVDNPIKRKKYF